MGNIMGVTASELSDTQSLCAECRGEGEIWEVRLEANGTNTYYICRQTDGRWTLFYYPDVAAVCMCGNPAACVCSGAFQMREFVLFSRGTPDLPPCKEWRVINYIAPTC